MAGERLQVADRLAALCEQGQAAMPEVVEPDGGRPVRTSRGLKNLLTTFCASTGTPCFVVNTRPLSRHSAPACSFSSSWRFLCPLGALTVL
ncbi:MAG: hypothetical protein WKF44_05005, partial [Rubrobacteraceae bacterium]